MELATTPEWQPVDMRQFTIWLERHSPDAPMGIAGGYTLHPVALYLCHRDGGFWCVEICREEVRFLNRRVPGRHLHRQSGWVLAFCWELKQPDKYRNITVADCLAALERVPW